MSGHWRRQVLTTIAFVGTLSAVLLADGVFVWRAGADLLEPQQRAIIHFANGVETVVYRRNLPPKLLSLLANDSSAGVRQSVARHQRTPETTLEQLANDPDKDVRRYAKQTLVRIRMLKERATTKPSSI